MSKEDETEELRGGQLPAGMVYRGDPLARFLIERLKLRKHTAALGGLAWSLIFLFFLPAISGCLWSRGGYLGSLNDWHAQLLLLVVFLPRVASTCGNPGPLLASMESSCREIRPTS